jgi:hypothetical protein
MRIDDGYTGFLNSMVSIRGMPEFSPSLSNHSRITWQLSWLVMPALK